MDRSERRREKHRVERERRRAERKQRRREDARKIKVKTTVLRDLRGMSDRQWDAFRALDLPACFARALEMFPHHLPLKRYARKTPDAPPLLEAEADEIARLLTMAARTLASDPPWLLPDFWPKREEGVSTFYQRTGECDTAENPELGRIGHWGLLLPWPGIGDVEVWFTTHAIERLTFRLALDAAVMVRACADAWMLLLRAADPEVRDLVPRRIVERDGETVLTLALRMGGAVEDLGYFPLTRIGPRAVATTFLEPWMETRAGRGAHSPEERERLQAAFVEGTVERVHTLFITVARGRHGDRFFPEYVDWLERMFNQLPVESNAWQRLLILGRRLARQGRFREGRTALEEGFARMAGDLRQLPPSTRRCMEEDERLQRAVAMAHVVLGLAYARAAEGQPDREGPAQPVTPEQAEVLRVQALAEVERGFAIDPTLFDRVRTNDDFAPLRADARWAELERRHTTGE